MTHPPPPYPDLEIELLANTVERAVDLVRAGAVEQGYQELQYGLERARTLLDEPWGEALARRYADACLNYAREWLTANTRTVN